MKKAVVLTHLVQENLGSFGDVLREAGYVIEEINVPLDGVDTLDPLEPDLLMIMGGPVGVYQAADYPFLQQEIDICKARIAADKPLFGICLGSQIIAAALGSKVYPGPAGKEVGWHNLTLTEAGRQSPVRHFAPELTDMFHWHGDTFGLPASVTLLASSALYPNQVYAKGSNLIAFQCHPEITERALREWYVLFTTKLTGEKAIVNLADLRAQTAERGPALKEQSRKFLLEWLGGLRV